MTSVRFLNRIIYQKLPRESQLHACFVRITTINPVLMPSTVLCALIVVSNQLLALQWQKRWTLFMHRMALSIILRPYGRHQLRYGMKCFVSVSAHHVRVLSGSILWPAIQAWHRLSMAWMEMDGRYLWGEVDLFFWELISMSYHPRDKIIKVIIFPLGKSADSRRMQNR